MIHTVSFPGLGLTFTLNRVAFTLLGRPVYWYGIIIASGLLLAVFLCGKWGKRFGITEDQITDMMICAVPVALIAIRAYYVIFNLGLYRRADGSLDWGAILRYSDGGLAIYGAILSSLVVLLIFCRVRKISFLSFADLGVHGLFIGQLIGRWGNFMNVEAYGGPTALPWRMCGESIAQNMLDQGYVDQAGYQAILSGNLGVHPTFLYESLWNLIGLFLVKAGGALIDNMAILFAIGVGVGMSEKNDGTGAIAALASWLMLTTLLSTGFVTTIMPSIAEDATKTLAFNKIANPFIGIIAGIIGSMCYNKFKDTKLPDWLSFFSGKRCVAIIAGVVSILASVVLLFVWPLLFGGLVALGEAIESLDVVGAGIYAFLNRLLIPTGLHHALNNVFWFDTIGLGDLQRFWAGETSADVSWSLGMYMSGFFPCMMFGVPGAALAMVKCAKPAKKKAAIGLVASAAICSFICGVTEPFEFAFMFLAPGLYVIYAALYGIFTMITVALGFRAGFSFSAGAMDLLFSSSLPAAQKTWLILPLGIAAFIVFYVVFLFAIKKFDLKTPGREDDDDLEAEKNIELANDDYTAIAAKILEGCGGKENITSIDNCVTRLRLEVKDITAVNDKVIKSAGVAGVIKPGKTSVQVIVGTKVQFVADAFSKLCE